MYIIVKKRYAAKVVQQAAIIPHLGINKIFAPRFSNAAHQEKIAKYSVFLVNEIPNAVTWVEE